MSDLFVNSRKSIERLLYHISINILFPYIVRIIKLGTQLIQLAYLMTVQLPSQLKKSN